MCESATIPTGAGTSQPITAYTISSSLGKIAFALVSAFLFLLISFPLPLFGFTQHKGEEFRQYSLEYVLLSVNLPVWFLMFPVASATHPSSSMTTAMRQIFLQSCSPTPSNLC